MDALRSKDVESNCRRRVGLPFRLAERVTVRRRANDSSKTVMRLGFLFIVLIIVLIMALMLTCVACSRPPQDGGSFSRDAQLLPFDRQPKSSGRSPSQSLFQSDAKLPEGATISVTLRNPVSSATAHTGDTFSAIVDEPLIVDGQILVPRGTMATGRVLEAKNSGSLLEPGYFRIVLLSLNLAPRPVAIETSSIFAKGGPREEINVSAGIAAGAAHEDVSFESGRRLNFRLAQTVDLQAVDFQKPELQKSDSHTPTLH